MEQNSLHSMNNPLQSKNGGEISLFKKKIVCDTFQYHFPHSSFIALGSMGSVLLKWLKHSKQLLCHSLYCSWVWQGTGIFFLSISLSLPPSLFFPLSPSARLSPNTEWLNYERQFPSPLKRKSSYSSCCCCSLAISRAKRASTATLTGIFQRNMNAVSLTEQLVELLII